MPAIDKKARMRQAIADYNRLPAEHRIAFGVWLRAYMSGGVN